MQMTVYFLKKLHLRVLYAPMITIMNIFYTIFIIIVQMDNLLNETDRRWENYDERLW